MRYIHYEQETIKTIAERIAETISVRSYEEGNSRDYRRIATDDEQEKIFSVVFGAIGNLNYHIYSYGHSYGKSRDGEIKTMMQTARDTAEWTIDQLIKLENGEEINGYDTVYCPIWAMSEMLWNEESDFTRRYAESLGISAEDLKADAEAIIPVRG